MTGPRRVWIPNTVAALISGLFLFPVVWALISSLQTPEAILEWPPRITLEGFTLRNFMVLLADPRTPIDMWFRNSLYAALTHSALSVIVAVMAGFALARLRFPGRDAYFKVLLGSMAIPSLILFLPNYHTVDILGWINSLTAIILPGLGATFAIFLLRQFFINIPTEIEEAAIVEGAGVWWRITRIIVPLSKEAVITVFVMNFMMNWNDYLWPLVVLYSPDKRTLPVGMATLQGQYVHDYGVTMAGAAIISIPSIIIFLLVQKYYVQGVSVSGAIK